MGEDKKLAIVFSKSQCSRYPKAHYTYKDRFGKPLKMSIVRLPSKLYRPSGLDFGVFDGNLTMDMFLLLCRKRPFISIYFSLV